MALNVVVLPAPFGPISPTIVAGVDLEADVTNGVVLAEPDVQLVRFEQCHRVSSCRVERAGRASAAPPCSSLVVLPAGRLVRAGLADRDGQPVGEQRERRRSSPARRRAGRPRSGTGTCSSTTRGVGGADPADQDHGDAERHQRGGHGEQEPLVAEDRRRRRRLRRARRRPRRAAASRSSMVGPPSSTANRSGVVIVPPSVQARSIGRWRGSPRETRARRSPTNGMAEQREQHQRADARRRLGHGPRRRRRAPGHGGGGGGRPRRCRARTKAGDGRRRSRCSRRSATSGVDDVADGAAGAGRQRHRAAADLDRRRGGGPGPRRGGPRCSGCPGTGFSMRRQRVEQRRRAPGSVCRRQLEVDAQAGRRRAGRRCRRRARPGRRR